MLILIRDTLMLIHYWCFKLHLPGEMWFHQQACHVQDSYID
jgi:hypothetical protein